MHLLFCDTINIVIPGQCLIYDHTKIFSCVLFYEYVAVRRILFVSEVTGSGYVEIYISGDGTPFATFIPTWPICLDLVEGLSRQYHWILSCR